MGYTTDFSGRFDLAEPMPEELALYLHAFSDTRRMRRNKYLTALRPDPIREGTGLPVGIEGGYFVGEGGAYGQAEGADVVDHSSPPKGQPGLWCKWVPTEDGQGIEWNGAEKFYEYVPWLEYLIEHFLAPAGHVLNGEVMWQGEEIGDVGKIRVVDNVVKILTLTWE